MTRALICEGACNPAVPSLDADVRDYRREMPVYGGKSTPAPSWLSGALKALKHTPHRIVTEEVARCQACEHVRRHGRVS